MKSNTILTLSKSGYLKTQREKEHYKITHLISGRQYQVCEDTVNVLNYFGSPSAIQTADLSEAMQKSVQYLLENGLLIDQESKFKDTFLTHLPSKTIFNVPVYDSQKTGQLVFLGVPFGGGNPSSPDPKRFPGFLRSFVENYQINLNEGAINYQCLGNDQKLHHLVNWVKQQLIADGGDVFIHHFEPRRKIYEKIRYIFDQVIAQGNIPFGIGGDHSITYPILQAISEHHNPFSILHFDAHTDLYDSAYEPILEEDGLHHHGNFVKKCLQLPGLQHYYQFGIRGINNIGHTAGHPKLKIAWVDQVRQQLQDNSLPELPRNCKYYITFDIDVFDPSIASATGTPVPNGLLWHEMMALFSALKIHERQVIGLDLVEINSKKDEFNLTTSLAVQLILNLINLVQPIL